MLDMLPIRQPLAITEQEQAILQCVTSRPYIAPGTTESLKIARFNVRRITADSAGLSMARREFNSYKRKLLAKLDRFIRNQCSQHSAVC